MRAGLGALAYDEVVGCKKVSCLPRRHLPYLAKAKISTARSKSPTHVSSCQALKALGNFRHCHHASASSSAPLLGKLYLTVLILVLVNDLGCDIIYPSSSSYNSYDMAWRCSGKSNVELIANMGSSGIFQSERVAKVSPWNVSLIYCLK